MLELKSKETRMLSVYFFLNPEKKSYARELAEKIGLDPSNTAKALGKLADEGLVIREKRGGHWFYFLNKEYPLLDEARKILMFKYGMAEMLKKKLKGLEGLEEAYIFGSYAKGDYGAESDIDVLLIGSHSAIKADERLAVLGKYFDREFNGIDMDRRELEKRRREKDDFIRDVFKGKFIKIL